MRCGVIASRAQSSRRGPPEGIGRLRAPSLVLPMTETLPARWPALDFADWRDTATTLQLWTQIVGKVRLALTPWLNHGWHVALYVNAHGIGTSPMPSQHGIVEIDFDFVEQRLVVRSSEGPDR